MSIRSVRVDVHCVRFGCSEGVFAGELEGDGVSLDFCVQVVEDEGVWVVDHIPDLFLGLEDFVDFVVADEGDGVLGAVSGRVLGEEEGQQQCY